jgi:hemolysin activation/secretion protein
MNVVKWCCPSLCGMILGLPSVLTGADLARPAEAGRSVPPPISTSKAVFAIQHVEFSGNTVFPSSDLEELAKPFFKDGEMDLVEVEQLRAAVTAKFIQAGYISSGALIDDQDVSGGILKVRVVEGQLEDIKVEGNRWMWKRVYKDNFTRLSSQPLNVTNVQNAMQMMRTTRPVDQINADLQPGSVPGKTDLHLKVREPFPFHAGVAFRNDLPPSSGANQVDFNLQADSLTGNADEMAFNMGVFRFGQGRSHWLPGDNFSVDYKVPLNAGDTRLGGFYRRSTASVLEEPFNELDIASDTASYGITLEQPLVRNLKREFRVSLTGERRENETFLLGFPYSFVDGPVDGRSVVAAARAAAQYVQRGTNYVFSSRLTVSGGVNALGATFDTGNERDGDFVSILAQAQMLYRIPDSRVTAVTRLMGQWANDPLLPMEQLAIGGAHTVRGYRENTFVRDTGVAGSLELRYALFPTQRMGEWLQLATFIDAGAGWNNRDITPSPQRIVSAGLGLLFNPHPNVNASIYWGHAFTDVVTKHTDAQDYGLHFQLNINAF